jgi:hypothetical protein
MRQSKAKQCTEKQREIARERKKGRREKDEPRGQPYNNNNNSSFFYL